MGVKVAGVRWVKGRDGIERAFAEFKNGGTRPSTMLREYFTDKAGKSKGEPRTKAELIEALENFKRAVRNGEHGKTSGSKMSVSDFIDYYKQNRWPSRKVSASVLNKLEFIRRHLGAKPLSAFTDPKTFTEFYATLARGDLTEIVKVYHYDKYGNPLPDGQTRKVTFRRHGPRAGGTLANYRMWARSLCGQAFAWELIDKDPFVRDGHLMGDDSMAGRGRKRGVTDEEYTALMQHASPRMRERIEVSYRLGPRVGELLNAQLEDIDFDNWLWHIPETKTDEPRDVPIPLSLQPLFKAKRQLFDGKAYIFGKPKGQKVTTLNGVFEDLKAAAGLDDATLAKRGKMDLHWHDLRGAAATRMLARNESAEIVSKVVGNSPQTLRKHYTARALLIDAMRKAVEE